LDVIRYLYPDARYEKVGVDVQIDMTNYSRHDPENGLPMRVIELHLVKFT